MRLQATTGARNDRAKVHVGETTASEFQGGVQQGPRKAGTGEWQATSLYPQKMHHEDPQAVSMQQAATYWDAVKYAQTTIR